MYVVSDWEQFGLETRFRSINDVARFLGVSSYDAWWAFNNGEMIEGYTIDKEF